MLWLAPVAASAVFSCASSSRCVPSASALVVAETEAFARSRGAARDWIQALLRGDGRVEIPLDCGVPRHPRHARCAWFRLYTDSMTQRCLGAMVRVRSRELALVQVAFQHATGASENVEELVDLDVAVRSPSSHYQLTVASLPNPTRVRVVTRTRRLRGGESPWSDEIGGPAFDSLLDFVSENELRFVPKLIISGSGWSIDLSRWFSTHAACERSLTGRRASP